MNQTIYEKGLEKGLELGIKTGIEQGIEQGIEKGIEQGIEQGIEKGIEQGIEKGIEKGRRVGQVELVCSLIEARFGSVPESARRDLEQLPVEALRHLALKVGTAASLAELGLSVS